MMIELGSVWTVNAPHGELVVVLSGPFGRDEAPEFMVSPLYDRDTPGTTASDMIPVRIGEATSYAALWNTRPAAAADLEQQLGRLTGADADQLGESYWSWLEDDRQDGLKELGNPLTKYRIRKFREKEVERWSPLSGAALSRRYGIDPSRAIAEERAVPTCHKWGWEEILSELSLKVTGPGHLADDWRGAFDVDLACYVGRTTLDLGEEGLSSGRHFITGPNTIMFVGMSGGQAEHEVARIHRAFAETTTFLQAWGGEVVGTMVRNTGLIRVDDKPQGTGQQSPIAGNRLTGILEPS